MNPPRPLAHLLEKQIRHRYRALDRALSAGVGPFESEFRLGGRPTIAWHARHIGEAIESTRHAVFGDSPCHAPGDSGAEGDLAAPAGEPSQTGTAPWPSPWNRLREAVLEAATAMASRLADATDDELSMPPRVPILPAFKASLGTRLAFLEGHIYHVTYHVGSIAVLRAEMGLDDGRT